MAKIIPLRGHFESLPALLASIVEQIPDARGLVACVIRANGDTTPVIHNAGAHEVTFAAALLTREALEFTDASAEDPQRQ